MALKKFKPVTPGTRFRVGNTFSEVTTDKPEKSLLAPMKKYRWSKCHWKNDGAKCRRWS